MPRHLVAFLALALLPGPLSFGNGGNGGNGADGAKAEKKAVVHAQLAERYFKNGTCRDFADYLLSRNGLPKLGQATPVRGARGSVDRRKDNQDPPLFTDEISKNGAHTASVKFSATGDQNQWVLSLGRAFGATVRGGRASWIETRFQFLVLEKNNVGSCEFTGLNFSAGQGAKAVFAGFFDTWSCLDALLTNPIHAQNASLAGAAYEQLKRDCALGLHYSLESKKLVNISK